MNFRHFCLVLSFVHLAIGGPAIRHNVPLTQDMPASHQRTQIGTEQSAEQDAASMTTDTAGSAVTDATDPNMGGSQSGSTPTAVDANSNDTSSENSQVGELQNTLIHPGGEIEKVYTGKPEEVENKLKDGAEQIDTLTKSDGEIEKIYVGEPTKNNSTNTEESKIQKEATATLAHDTFNISIPLKEKTPAVFKYIGNETEGVYLKSAASENFKTNCVSEHNKKRFIHNARPLVWSDKIAQSAQTWADHLAEIDSDIQDPGNKKYGENIFWTRPQLPEDELCKAAVDEWYNEVKLYDFSASHKRNFDPQPVNEFIQLVYEGQTREVGVAFSLSRTNKQYVVARYYKKRNNMMLDSEVHPAHSDGAKVRFDKPVYQRYNMIVRLPHIPWLPQYEQPNSPVSQHLENKMKNAFKATFQETPTITSLVDLKMNSFKLDDRQPESAILADIDVKFYPYVKDPIQRLKNSIFHGQLNGMAMDDNFLKVFNKTGFYEPPTSWKEKMTSTDLQADLNAPNMAIDPITGAPTNIKYPQSISEDIDLVDRKPCQGGVCETYLIKDRCNGNSENCPPLSAMQSDSTPSSSVSTQPTNSYTPQPCCDQMPTPTPCLALACPPPPACNPTCKSRVPGNWPPEFYRRGKITTRRNSDGDK
ncbi:uncharacterized protein LOC124438425 [Xenia sp. Carnegie-2017]|uniref:uncharacterized protein LOC124438425 n=1 Tax=Xenia sp. Carnegie-2017 TaxID=2897299 RepID=UPI001F044F79|nr:uncharacterized protein LOC124438425 [Xenia sp. Carnegie-2017]